MSSASLCFVLVALIGVSRGVMKVCSRSSCMEKGFGNPKTNIFDRCMNVQVTNFPVNCVYFSP